jgi:phage RecT family recombinase
MAQTQTADRQQQQQRPRQEAPREAPRGQPPARRDQQQKQQQPPTQEQRKATELKQINSTLTVQLRQFQAQLEQMRPLIMAALPKHMSWDRYFRVVLTAVTTNPDLLAADRRTLFNATIKCAVDGLVPDGRQAALVIYNTKIKVKDHDSGTHREAWIQAVQYMPMVLGLRDRMRNTGEVLSATAEAVFENDKFTYSLGDEAFIRHEPPPLGQDRGEVIGAYAIIRLANGDTIRDVLTKKEIEAAKGQSRAQDSLMWTKFYWEGARKTALRRAAKQAPMSAELRGMVDREEEDPMTGPLQDHFGMPDFEDGGGYGGEPEPERPRQDRRPSQQQQPDPEYPVIDLDGVEHLYQSGFRAYDALRLLMDEAAARGLSTLEGFWDSNQSLLEMMAATGFVDQTGELAGQYADARDQVRSREEAERVRSAASSNQQSRPPGQAADQTPPANAPSPSAAGPEQGQREQQEEPPPPDDNDFPGDLPQGQSLQQPRPTQGPANAGASSGTAATSAQAGSPTNGASGSNTGPTATSGASPSEGGSPQSLEIPMRVISGKADCRTWAIAQFGPKAKRFKNSTDFATFLGANDKQLEACRQPGALDASNLKDLNQLIDDQWAAIKKIESAA